jgi:hypothetical protein
MEFGEVKFEGHRTDDGAATAVVNSKTLIKSTLCKLGLPSEDH